MTNLREYYAAPAFNEASLIERRESIRRNKELDSVIENLDYQASSPDEKALVEACGKIGFLFVGEQNDTIVIKLQMNNNVSLSVMCSAFFLMFFFIISAGIYTTGVWWTRDQV